MYFPRSVVWNELQDVARNFIFSIQLKIVYTENKFLFSIGHRPISKLVNGFTGGIELLASNSKSRNCEFDLLNARLFLRFRES